MDILVQAVKSLEENIRNQIKVIMVCPDAEVDDYNMIKEIPQISMVGEKNKRKYWIFILKQMCWFAHQGMTQCLLL